MVLSAQAKGEPGSDEALARLCEAYWYPLYFYCRRQGHAPEDALDLTQGYFLRLMERDYLASVRPEAGRFRSFLLASLKHYLANERREARALKRGGGRALISLDGETAEDRYRHEPPDERTPDKAYERRWALTVLEHAHRRLEEELSGPEQREQYRVLSAYLSGDGGKRPYREAAEELGSTEAAIRMAVSRLRRRFGNILREEIAQTVHDDSELEQEVRFLLSAVR